MIKIYCELGSLTKEIKQLKSERDLEFLYFPFENQTKKIKQSKKPSNLLASNAFILSSSSILLKDTKYSDKYAEIESLIGKHNFRDIQHIDTAYKENCQILITPDKDDIANFRNEIFQLTNVMCFHHSEINAIYRYIENLKNKN